tara:strand:+ start:44 stop:358 length:315 start_codon:yes stop_codon:yes gene_type:complete
MLHEKIIFYPLSALHVVVTEIVYSQWRRLLSSWRKKQLNEKSKIIFLKLKCHHNLAEIDYTKKILSKMINPNSNITFFINELTRLYEIQIDIERKNNYYYSIYS